MRRSLNSSLMALATGLLLLAPGASHAGPPVGGGLVGGDFDGDGKADLAYQGATGSASQGVVRVDLHDGPVALTTGFLGDGGGAWEIRAAGDTNNDTRDDIVFQGRVGSAAFGAVRIDHMNGVVAGSKSFLSNGGGVWDLFGVADFDANGSDDPIFVGVAGSPAAGFIRVDLTLSGSSRMFIPTGGGTWVLVGTGDPNGDGKADMLFLGTGAGAGFYRLTLIDGATPSTPVTGTAFLPNAGGAWVFAGFGDTDGDGKDDIGYQGSGSSRIQQMNGTTVTSTSFFGSGPFSLFGLSDLSGDGKADAVYAGATVNRVDLLNGATTLSQGFPGNSAGGYTLAKLSDVDGNSSTDLISVGSGAVLGLVNVQVMNGGAVSTAGTRPNAGGTLELK